MTKRASRQAYNAYMRTYMLKRYRSRRRKAIKDLGGKCVKCGSTKRLEFDHRDPKKKSFSLWCRTYSEERLAKELAKCQLLCKMCYIKKSILERGHKIAKGTHGTLSAYAWCGPPKCDACRKAKTDYMIQYYLRKPRYSYKVRQPKHSASSGA